MGLQNSCIDTNQMSYIQHTRLYVKPLISGDFSNGTYTG